MRHIIFEEGDTYPIAVLAKNSSFNKNDLLTYYTNPLIQEGIPANNIIAFNLEYDDNNKASVGFIKSYLASLLPALIDIGVEYLYVADSNYFKVLTKSPKADPHWGYVLPCKIEGFEQFQVVLGLNYQALIYNPTMQSKLDMSLQTLAQSYKGTHTDLGTDIIHSAYYPDSLEAIAEALDSLHQYERISADIEGFSLAFNEAGVATIGFAWDQHNGISFACDYSPIFLPDGNVCPDAKRSGIDIAAFAGFKKINYSVRALLRQFFTRYKGKVIWHNATYDVRSLIYALWMKDLKDYKGMLEGLHVMCRCLEDTKLIAYLATNSTAGNQLGLKALAHEFAGNWAVDEIKDVRKIELPKLLQYNLVDCLSTNYVFDKYTPIMQADNQESVYRDLFLPAVKVIVQMELVGMPMDPAKIAQAKKQLEEEAQRCLDVLDNSKLIQMFNLIVQKETQQKANAKLKTKQHPLSKYAHIKFNPNSGPQLQALLYDQMGLPVLDLTEKKQPATGGDTLKKLINHTQEPAYKEIIQALIDYTKVNKILAAFIPAFEKGVLKQDGLQYLHGGFNLGGTVSGRLSSSKPNLQQIPSGSDYGKLIKDIFTAPEGWIMAGADFNSLEDYISALTTKDPNKLNVYIKGFDGHCLRAGYYFREDLLARGISIALDDPTSVNSIKKLAPDLRQDSKAPTFLLTYGGTYHGMMKNLGWPEDKSKSIEANYHTLYAVSDQYVEDRLKQAAKDGYVEVAFGLRVRTPLLKQVMWGLSGVPYEASAEGRTAGNALGQSYGLLNTRAANEFMQKVWASEFALDILPIAQIHDAIYLLIRDDLRVVEWVNSELIKSMQWQELPEIQHDQVKLGAELDLFWPSWAYPITLPNEATPQSILDITNQAQVALAA